MVCRHAPGDPNCSSSPQGRARSERTYRESLVADSRREQNKLQKEIERLKSEIAGLTIDATRYEVLEAEQVGDLLCLKVSYPSCKNCSHEGIKVMVLRASLKDGLFWRRIDPHFGEASMDRTHAPPPICRFPGTDEGWQSAIEYCRWVSVPPKTYRKG